MTLKETIYRRKSVRSYTSQPVEKEKLAKIETFIKEAKALYPDIKVYSEIVEKDIVKCILPWLPKQHIAVYSEEKDGWLENVGFIFQQLDLFLQSMGIGCCWLGMGKIDPPDSIKLPDESYKFAIILSFGYPKGEALRNGKDDFKRKSLSEISDREDMRLEGARYAPSSVNSQPWYFTHEGDELCAWCVKKGLIGQKTLGNMNRIDMGIALAHLYVENPDTFEFFKNDAPGEVKGYGYTGSFKI